jgi:hypothetical protein
MEWCRGCDSARAPRDGFGRCPACTERAERQRGRAQVLLDSDQFVEAFVRYVHASWDAM